MIEEPDRLEEMKRVEEDFSILAGCLLFAIMAVAAIGIFVWSIL